MGLRVVNPVRVGRGVLASCKYLMEDFLWSIRSKQSEGSTSALSRPLRILYVGMAASIHLARFLSQVTHRGWDLHLFNSNTGWSYGHPDLRQITLHGCLGWAQPEDLHPSVRFSGYWKPNCAGIVSAVTRRVFPHTDNAVRRLARAIDELQPDIIHSHEIQHGAYLVMGALPHLRSTLPPWVVTNWGSDVNFYGRLKAHKERIRAVMGTCQYYTCETERDVGLARAFGFAGEILEPVMPNPGGFRFHEIEHLRNPTPPSRRRVIMLKGYQGEIGRALCGLHAIEMCRDLLAGYKILIHSTAVDVATAAELLRHDHGLDVEVLPHLEYYELLRLRGQARISMGISLSDAASISFLEALVMGSFPIQSYGGGAPEWIEDGKTGFLVPPENPCAIATALRRALSDDALVDSAAAVNYQTARNRLDFYSLREHVVGWYDHIIRSRRGAGIASRLDCAAGEDVPELSAA